jgi:uncharacterized membrane protein (UPF0136 family)
MLHPRFARRSGAHSELGRPDDLGQPAAMHDFKIMVLWVYIILLLVGGLIGFFKAKSRVSLITSAVFAALLVLAAIPGIFDRRFAFQLTNILLAVLLVVFAVRLSQSKKFMPSGLMLVLTIVALALRNLVKD